MYSLASPLLQATHPVLLCSHDVASNCTSLDGSFVEQLNEFHQLAQRFVTLPRYERRRPIVTLWCPMTSVEGL